MWPVCFEDDEALQSWKHLGDPARVPRAVSELIPVAGDHDRRHVQPR